MLPPTFFESATFSLRIIRRILRKKRSSPSSTARSSSMSANLPGAMGSWSATVSGNVYNRRQASVVPDLGKPVRTMFRFRILHHLAERAVADTFSPCQTGAHGEVVVNPGREL